MLSNYVLPVVDLIVPPSEQTINEPSPSEEMSIIEPSTVDEDVWLSEPSCNEEACTSHQNISDTGEVNV